MTVHSNKAADPQGKTQGQATFPLRLPGAIEAAGVSLLNKESLCQTHLSLSSLKRTKDFLEQ